jgi:hypothetical protein
MQFLTPLFWIAAAAVALPVLLHLTRREVKRPIPFASLMFLKRIPVQEFRRRKIRHWLLLALRCLALLALVAAFTQPVINRLFLAQVAGTSRISAVLLVDHSLSMSRPAVWRRAKTRISDAISDLERGDEGCLVAFGVRPEILQPWTADGAQLKAAVGSRLRTSFEATSYSAGLRAATEQLEQAHNQFKRIVLVTDLQSSGLDRSLGEVDIPAGVDLEVEDVGQDGRNIYIDSVRVDRDVYGAQYPHTIVVRLASSSTESGSSTGTQGNVQLFVADRLVDDQKFSLSDAGTATVGFKPFEIEDGITRGRLVVDLKDDLPADDTWNFTIAKRAPFQVQLVTAHGTQEDSVFLRQALSAGANLPFAVHPVDARTDLDLKGSRVIILSDLNSLPDRDALDAFVRQGGGLIVCLGSDTQPYGDSDLLPARLLQKHYGRAGGNEFVTLSDLQRDHPVFAPFKATGVAALNAVRFYGYWEMEPVPDSTVLARFSSGAPALVERQVGEGHVLLFASSLNRIWSDFPIHSSYVPFWQELVQYAADWKDRPSQFLVNQVFSLTGWETDSRTRGEHRWEMLDPGGRRLIGLAESEPDYVMLEKPGYYELRWEKTTDWIAVNVDRSESDLTRIRSGEMLSALRNSQLRPGPASRAAAAREATTAEPLWPFLLGLALVLLLTESLVANRISRRASETVQS